MRCVTHVTCVRSRNSVHFSSTVLNATTTCVRTARNKEFEIDSLIDIEVNLCLIVRNLQLDNCKRISLNVSFFELILTHVVFVFTGFLHKETKECLAIFYSFNWTDKSRRILEVVSHLFRMEHCRVNWIISRFHYRNLACSFWVHWTPQKREKWIQFFIIFVGLCTDPVSVIIQGNCLSLRFHEKRSIKVSE